MLPQDKKEALKNRVQEMIDAGADDATIQEAIDIVTKKYDVPEASKSPVNSTFNQGLNDQIINLQKGIVKIPKDEPYGQNNKVETTKSNAPDIGEAVFPRFAKRTNQPNSTFGQRLNAAGSDILSLPGRTIASASDPSLENLADTKGKTTFGKIIRSPATGAAIAVAPLTGGASLGALATGIGLSAVAGAGEQQLENFNDDKKFSGKELATDVAGGLAGGVLGAGVGKYVVGPVIKGVVNKIASRSLSTGVNDLFSTIKPSGKMVENGFKKPVLIENEIMGTPSEALAKTNAIIDQHANEIKNVVSSAVGKNGQEPTVNVIGVLSDLSNPANNHLQKGFSKEQTAALQDLLERSGEIDPNGQIKLSDIPKVKKIIVELRNDFNNPPSGPSDAILGKAYKAIDDEFIGTVDKMGADGARLKASNKKISELIPVASTIEKKINQGIEEKTPGLVGKVLGNTFGSVKNIGAELMLHSVAPGAATAIKTASTVADHYSPVIASKFLNMRQNLILQQAIKDPNYLSKLNQPQWLQNMFSPNGPTANDIKELERYYLAHFANQSKAITSNRANAASTVAGKQNFGSMVDSLGNYLDHKDDPKSR